MKFFVQLLITALIFYSCNNAPDSTEKNNSIVTDPVKPKTESADFFPVTDYFQGQLSEIRNKGINPLKLTNLNNRIDSTWIRMEQLDSEFELFLFPVIDSTNLNNLFTESKFLDQTINAFTFTYDPSGPLPDTFSLKHWDVYIDPQTNEVKRVYLLKKTAGNKTIQLTWLHGKSCRIVSLVTDKDGKTITEKEVTIKWDF